MQRVFTCPKCGETVKGIMRGAGHKCPKNQSKWTDFKECEETGDE